MSTEPKHAAAVKLWEDTVGDSGEAPTDEELDSFYKAAQVEALRTVADAAFKSRNLHGLQKVLIGNYVREWAYQLENSP